MFDNRVGMGVALLDVFAVINDRSIEYGGTARDLRIQAERSLSYATGWLRDWEFV
jgi:hypothetical protein